MGHRSQRRSANKQARAVSRRSVEHFVQDVPDEIQEITEELRKVLKQAGLTLEERVYPGWRLIGYRVVKEKKSHYFTCVAPFLDKMVLGFEYGRWLADPTNSLEGSGTQVRHLIFRSMKHIKGDILLPLILEAASLATSQRAQMR